ncbi:MAG: hypothetical protein J6038_00480, partial [Bacilli bacterium]|nr:hypothetical protein [Bacilli bacterium]
MNHEYDEDFLDENEGSKKSEKMTESSQPNPEEPQKKRGFSSPKAALCALFGLLSGLFVGLGFAGFAVPVIFNAIPSPFFTYAGFGGGVVLLVLSIVFGFLSKSEAKKNNQEPPRLGFVTSFFLSRLLTALSVIGLIAIFLFCLGASIFNPQNYFDSLAG